MQRGRVLRPVATKPFVEAARESGDGEQVDQLTGGTGKPHMFDRGHAQSKQHSSADGAVIAPGGERTQQDRPRDVCGASLRSVDQGVWGLDFSDGESLVGPSVVRNDIADGEGLPARVDAPGGTATRWDEPFDTSGEVPAGALFSELHHPRPDLSRSSRDSERPVHDDVRFGNDCVAWPGLGLLAGGSCDVLEHLRSFR